MVRTAKKTGVGSCDQALEAYIRFAICTILMLNHKKRARFRQPYTMRTAEELAMLGLYIGPIANSLWSKAGGREWTVARN
jgi:hypothetical protein